MTLTLGVLLFAAVGATAGFTPALNADTHGNCSPVIVEVNNDVNINCVFLASSDQRLEQARRNIDYVLRSFQSIGYSNTVLLEPSLHRYAEHPTPQAWASISDYANMSLELVKAAILSVIVSQPDLKTELGPHLQTLLSLADQKSTLLHQLVGWEGPPTEEEALQWAVEYQETILPLWEELSLIRDELGQTSSAAGPSPTVKPYARECHISEGPPMSVTRKKIATWDCPRMVAGDYRFKFSVKPSAARPLRSYWSLALLVDGLIRKEDPQPLPTTGGDQIDISLDHFAGYPSAWESEGILRLRFDGDKPIFQVTVETTYWHGDFGRESDDIVQIPSSISIDLTSD